MGEPTSIFDNVPDAPPAATGGIDAMYDDKGQLKTTEPIKHPDIKPDKFRATNIEYENRRLASDQRTSPHLHDYNKNNYVGEASINDANQVFIKGEDGELTPTDNKKHVVLQDPEDTKYKVYNRSEDTDYGPMKSKLQAAGNLVNEGFATTPHGFVRAVTPAQRAVQAATDLKDATGVGVTIPKVAITDNPATKIVAGVVSHIPGGSGPMEKAAGRMQGGLDQAAEAASEIPTGVKGNVQEAGQAAKFGIEQRIKSGDEGLFNQQTKQAYDKVDSYIKDPTAKTPLDNTLTRVQDIVSRFSATEREGMPESVKSVLGAVTHPEGLTYQGLKDLRSGVGEDIQRGVNTGMSQGELKQLYGALSDDLKATVLEQGGKKGLAAWEKANAVAEVLARNKDKLHKILGTDTKSDEAIFNTLHRMAGSTASADAKTLALAKRSMSSSEWNEVASGVVSRLGRTGTGTGATFDPSKFVKDFRTLSPAGKDLMFGADNKLRTSLEKISELSQEPWHGAADPAHAPGELAHLGLLAGFMHHLGTALGAVMGVSVISKILSRPATADNVAKWMQSDKFMSAKPTKRNVQIYSQLTNALSYDAADQAREELGQSRDWAGRKGVEIAKSIRESIWGK